MTEVKTKKAAPKAGVDEKLLKVGFYKGYDMRWLREIPEHPDYSLVAEYDALEKKK